MLSSGWITNWIREELENTVSPWVSELTIKALRRYTINGGIKVKIAIRVRKEIRRNTIIKIIIWVIYSSSPTIIRQW